MIKCEKCGHEYEETAAFGCRQTECPKCFHINEKEAKGFTAPPSDIADDFENMKPSESEDDPPKNVR
jgi:hypothetical protein